jgi:hypothetical protein
LRENNFMVYNYNIEQLNIFLFDEKYSLRKKFVSIQRGVDGGAIVCRCTGGSAGDWV